MGREFCFFVSWDAQLTVIRIAARVRICLIFVSVLISVAKIRGLPQPAVINISNAVDDFSESVCRVAVYHKEISR